MPRWWPDCKEPRLEAVTVVLGTWCGLKWAVAEMERFQVHRPWGAGGGGPRPRGNPTWVPSPALRDSTSPWVLTRDPRGRSLPDVNECDSSPCSQECANVYGSYQCYCRRGYQLSDVDGVTCEGERMAPCTPSPSRLPGRGALCLFLLTEGRLGTPNPLSRVRFPKAKATHQVFL